MRFVSRRSSSKQRQRNFSGRGASVLLTDGQLPEAAQGSADYVKMMQQVQEAQAVAQLQALNQKMKSAPLPENALTRVFALKYGKPGELSRVLADIVGERGMRTGVDDRSNSLIVSADDKTMSIIDALVKRLDSPGGGSPSSNFSDTLQIRVIWLLDEMGNQDANESIVNSQVLEALKKLGFKSPGVISQQVASLTLDDKNRGRFNFLVPVLIGAQPWKLGGNGMVTQERPESFCSSIRA